MPSDIIAVIEDASIAFLLNEKTEVTNVVTNLTPETAAKTLRSVAPPAKVKCAIVSPGHASVELSKRCVDALRKEGYTNIETVESIAINLSACIHNLPLYTAIGEPVFVCCMTDFPCSFKESMLFVIERCHLGWLTVETAMHPLTALSKYPSVRNVVIYKGAPQSIKTDVKKLFPGRKLHLAETVTPESTFKYLLNRANKGNLNGYEVLPFCNMDLCLEFSDRTYVMPLRGHMPPFSIEKELDIGDSPDVKAHCLKAVGTTPSLYHLKTFKFKKKEFRKVSVTVNIDETLFPEVTLKTASTYPSMSATMDAVMRELALKKRNSKSEYYETMKAHLLKNDIKVILVLKETFSYMISPGGSMFFYDTKTPESMIARFREVAAIESAVGALAVIDYGKVKFRQQALKALFKTGYPNIQTIDTTCLTLSITIDGLPLECAIGDYAFVNLTTQFKDPFAKYPLYVIQKCEDGWQLIDTLQTATNALSQYRSVRNVVISEHCSKSIQSEVEKLFPGRKLHLSRTLTLLMENQFMWSRSIKDEQDGYTVFPKSNIDLLVQFGTKSDTIAITNRVPPFTEDKEIDVGDASEVTVRAFNHGKIESTMIVKTLKFKKVAFRKILVTVSVDKNFVAEVSLRTASTYKPVAQPASPPREDATDSRIGSIATLPDKVSKLDLNLAQKTILTFTSDNRVLIEADESYTGDKELLAYVRLEVGKPPVVGQLAFEALKTHPESVFYDITRLLATDFDPNHPDSSWGFKTTRDADGKVVVHGNNGVTTFPIVLFGLVVKCTLTYIGEHLAFGIDVVEIRIPLNTFISDADLKGVSDRIGTKLVVVNGSS